MRPWTTLLVVLLVGTPVQAQVAVVWSEAENTVARAALMRTRDPWSLRRPRIAAGPEAVLHYDRGRLYIVSRAAGTITVASARSGHVRRVLSVGAGSEPEDIAVVSTDTAYVTRRRATSLLRLDLRSGDAVEVVDLSRFADADGIPDLGLMLLHEGRLFVQIRRLNEDGPLGLSPPGYLAVVDVASEELVDVDPTTPGIQAIELAAAPKHRMQVVRDTGQLFVGATGGFFDEGGIEAVDLATLRSTGQVLREADGFTGADIGAFVMVTPARGYVVYSTDLDLSSHLKPFSLEGGVEPGPEMHVTVGYFVPSLVFDPASRSLFVPDGAFSRLGIFVFDVDTNQRLSTSPTAIPGPPTDLISLIDRPLPQSVR